MADYYQVLGVEKGATEQEIKRAYRKLAHEHHPDTGGGDDARFKEVSEAYQTLSDPEKRAHYDRFGTAPGEAPAGGPGGYDFTGGGFDFSGGGFADIFETFFGGQGARQTARPQGQDLEVQLMVAFEEAVFGATKELDLTLYSLCENCSGSGAEPGSELSECDRCHGSGQEERIQRTVLGQIRTAQVCSKCRGRGQVPEKTCRECRGEGRIRRHRKVSVQVPAGIDQGQSIRLRGEGEAGPYGSPAGDLYVQVVIRAHPRLRREGRDLYTEARVDVATAALGGEAEVETLEGAKRVKIPAGTQSGKVIKLSGAGVPALGGDRRGELLIEIQVETPTKLSKKAKQLLEDLKKEL